MGHRIAEISQYDPANPPADFATITTNYENDNSGRLIAVILPPCGTKSRVSEKALDESSS